MKPGDVVYVRCIVKSTTHDALSVAEMFRPDDYQTLVSCQPINPKKERYGPAILIPREAILTLTELRSKAVAMANR